jgi:ubiquinone biosynthesis protein UbiJ
VSTLPGASLLAAAVEYAVNSALSGSNSAQQDLKQLAGKVIELQIKEWPLKLYFLPQPEKLSVASSHEGKPDISIRAPTGTLLTAALKRDSGNLRGIEINGDAETAQQFSRLLKQADLDWEELLSRYVGDAAAHQIGNAVRDLMSWGRDAAERLSKDLAEYLQYESRDLPPRHEVQDFLNNVDKLRDDAERLAARLQRAASRVKQA